MPTSYNGWEASPDKDAIGIAPFGDNAGYPFPGGVRSGDVATVLGYVATQLHLRVEPAIDGSLWGYDYRANVNNPSTLSCHSSGTAIDWNAVDHANGAHGTWTDAQVGEVRRILDEVQGAVQWGEDYTGTIDGMHFEIIVDAGTLAQVAASLPGGTTGGDWFDMATEEDLRRIVGEEIDARLGKIGTATWTTAVRDGQLANALLAAAADNAQWAAAGVTDVPVKVWNQDITGDADGSGKANALLAQAARG